MKLIEAINRFDALKHNTYSQPEKINWLSRVDNMVKRHIIDTHEGAEDVTFTGYDDSTDPQTELLAPPPYDEMYLHWMEAMVDYYNGEYGKYNNAAERFNESYGDFQKYYNRTHMPKGKKIKYF